MDKYYVELSRTKIMEAIEVLGQAEQYLIRANAKVMYEQIDKTISGLRNRHRELGGYLKSGMAK